MKTNFKITESKFGSLISNDNYLVFFGNRFATLDKLKTEFPKFSFRFTKQVHGHKIISSVAGSEHTEADGHYTNLLNCALTIKTADCCPLFFSSNQKIFALHAGWKSIEQNIISKALDLSHSNVSTIYGGPHIGPKSFEVDIDVANLLCQPFSEIEHAQICKPTNFPNKRNINIALLIQSHFSQSISLKEFYFSPIDTKTDLNYFSYRRDQKEVGRNLSFIAKVSN